MGRGLGTVHRRLAARLLDERIAPPPPLRAGRLRRRLLAVVDQTMQGRTRVGWLRALRRRFAPLGLVRHDRAMTTLADQLVPDELWALVEPLLPVPPRPPYGGRHRAIPARNCLAAIVFMARTSTPWRLLPARELGCGSPATCWRWLTEWAAAGVFDALHLAVLDRLGEQDQVDWSRVSVDSMSVRARRGGPGGRKSRRSWQAWEQAPPGL
jgi:transposase